MTDDIHYNLTNMHHNPCADTHCTPTADKYQKMSIGDEQATFSRAILPESVFQTDSAAHPDVSICLVNWNTRDLLKDCLTSIFDHTDDLQIEVFVIDNASTDDSCRMVKENFPQVHVIENTLNRGFAYANNQGIQMARGRHVFLLNPDTVVMADAIAGMAAFLDTHPRAGAVAARLLNSDGTLQYSLRQFPNFMTPFTENTNLSLIPGIRRYSRKSRLMNWSHDTIREVEQPAGAALMIKRSCIDTLGSLNKCFHMFFEDVDICYRIRRNGWKIFYLPDSRIVHHGGQSVKKRTDMGTQFYRSLIKFFRIHRGRTREIGIRSFMVLVSSYCLLFSLVVLVREPHRGIVVMKSAVNVMRAAFFKVPAFD